MKNKNKNTSFSDFLRYRKGEMTNAERNSFEKELERDPFMAEAFAGLEPVNHPDAEADLNTITGKLRRRAGNRNFVIYRIAASVAVLMIISSVFIVIERNRPESQEAMPENKSVTLDIARSEPLREPEETTRIEKHAPPKVKKSSPVPEMKEDKVSYDMVMEKEAQNEEVESSTKSVKYVQQPRIPDSNRFLAEGIAASQPAAAARSVRRMDVPETDAPPQPEGGQEAFDRYISENIRRPDTAMSGQRIVIVTSFRVKTDGSPDSIKIIKSPRKEFSDEAIRLIKEGPVWKPAIRGGVAVEEEVSLRIVFP